MADYPEGCDSPEDRANWDYWVNRLAWERAHLADAAYAREYPNDPWVTLYTDGKRKADKITPDDSEPF